MDLIGFVPQFNSLALTLIAFVVALTVIVAIHEYGHYIVGRWTGIKADVFSIGIGPVLTSRTDKHGTRWQIAALPVGGYVKFRGDANAASAGTDEEAMRGLTDAERRATMPGAPVWARALTVAAGPVFNFVLSILVFAGFFMMTGVATDPLTVASVPEIAGYEDSLRPGDEILAVDGVQMPPLEGIGDFVAALPAKSPLEYLVRRDGMEQSVLALHPFPAIVQGVTPSSAADDAGLAEGDLITRANGDAVSSFFELQDVTKAGQGDAIALDVLRGSQNLEFTLTPRQMDLPLADGGFETRYLIGIRGGYLFEPATRMPGIVESLGSGVDQTKFIITASISGLYHMVKGSISSCNLRGPIGIAQVSGQAAAQGLGDFIWFIAVLSTAVGLLNLFPIPILDGGHLVFHAWEAVTGKPPADWAMRILMTIGLVLVLGLMAFGLTNDLFCP